MEGLEGQKGRRADFPVRKPRHLSSNAADGCEICNLDFQSVSDIMHKSGPAISNLLCPPVVNS